MTAPSTSLLDGKPLYGTAEWPEGSQLAVGDILLELALPATVGRR